MEYNAELLFKISENSKELLNPEGQHGCGILFLKSFMQDIRKF